MPAMTANTHEVRPELAQNRLFWGALGTLVVALLLAFWMVCSQQVRQAEARDDAITAEQMALADCLRYIPGSTIASCSSQMGQASMVKSQPAAVTGAMPVSFSYR